MLNPVPAEHCTTPLCVDLDGSFLKTDTLFESALCLLKLQPWIIASMLFWSISGKANLKAQIARRVEINVRLLPVNQRLLDWLLEDSQLRNIVLVTGSNQRFADAVKLRYPFFCMAYGSDDAVNLTGDNKRQLLVRLYGNRGFDYVGNDKMDRVVWSAARKSYFAGASHHLSRFADIEFEDDLSHTPGGISEVIRMLRPHQWTKNLLVLLPLFLDQQLGQPYSVFMAVLGFVAFCLLASATYIINDLLDLSYDRQNTIKQHRALASGNICITQGILVSATLLLATLLLTLALPLSFSLLMGVYLVSTFAYSLFFKTRIILDVIMIAMLHTLRIIAGALVIQAEYSFWLLTFSLFVFTSLALAKRVSELINLDKENRQAANGRGYAVGDIPLLTSAGVSAGYVAVLVIALFINSDKVLQHYNYPEILWILCPGFLYWIGRLWLLTSRGEINEDPIIYILKDKDSVLTLSLFLLVVSVGLVI